MHHQFWHEAAPQLAQSDPKLWMHHSENILQMIGIDETKVQFIDVFRLRWLEYTVIEIGKAVLIPDFQPSKLKPFLVKF